MAVSIKGDSADPMVEPNVIPLVDIMLVLLIIFIITIPVMTHAVKIDLPRDNPNPPDAAAGRPDLRRVRRLPSSGTARRSTPRPCATTSRSRTRSRTTSKPEVHVDAHRRVPYVYVANVLFTLQRGGLQKVGFVSGGGATVRCAPHPPLSAAFRRAGHDPVRDSLPVPRRRAFRGRHCASADRHRPSPLRTAEPRHARTDPACRLGRTCSSSPRAVARRRSRSRSSKAGRARFSSRRNGPTRRRPGRSASCQRCATRSATWRNGSSRRSSRAPRGPAAGGANGVGFYFTATDRDPAAGEFKFMTQGALQVGTLTLWFTILTERGPGHRSPSRRSPCCSPRCTAHRTRPALSHDRSPPMDGLALGAGAALGLRDRDSRPRAHALADCAADPSSGERIPVIGLGSSATFRRGRGRGRHGTARAIRKRTS